MRLRLLLLLFVVPLLAGCPEPPPPSPSLSPSLGPVEAGPAFQGQPVPVSVTVTIPGASDLRVRSVTAEYRRVTEPAQEWIPAPEELTGSATSGYSGTLPPMNFGQHEVQVRVQMRPLVIEGGGPEAPDTFLNGSASFLVNVDDALAADVDDPECFGFADEGQDLQGWSLSGMSADGSPVDGCDGVVWAAQDDGALGVPLAFTCMPEGIWQFDFVSPDLGAKPGWSETGGVLMRLDANFPLEARAVLVTAGGTEHVGPVLELGDPLVQFLTSVEPIDLGGESPFQIRVRINNVNAQLSGGVAEGFVFLGAVCPIVGGRP